MKYYILTAKDLNNKNYTIIAESDFKDINFDAVTGIVEINETQASYVVALLDGLLNQYKPKEI